jgi:hypothetical protein
LLVYKNKKAGFLIKTNLLIYMRAKVSTRRQFGKKQPMAPRDVAQFYAKYPKSLSDLRVYPMEIRQLSYYRKPYQPYRPGFPMGVREEIMREFVSKITKTVNTVKALLPQRGGGSGVVFLFPMTSSAGAGEFIKGMLHVLAPKAQTKFLVTPQSVSSRSPSEHVQNLENNLRKSIPHNSKQIILIDENRTGASLALTRKLIQKIGYKAKFAFSDSISIYRIINYFIPEGNYTGMGPGIDGIWRLGWEKNEAGTRLFAHYDKFTQKLARRQLYDLGIALAREHQQARQQTKT